LLGLEILVAADIIRTVALDSALQNVLISGLLVMIRTFLGWSSKSKSAGRGNRRAWNAVPRKSAVGCAGSK
jgi:hypothetical protein